MTPKDNKFVICHLMNYAPSFHGNFMFSLFDLEKKIKEHNQDNKVIYTFYKDTEKQWWAKEMIQDNKNVYFLTNKKTRGFSELKKIIKDNNVNIIHFHFTISPIIIFLLNIFFPRVRIIIHFHNILSGYKPSFLYKIKIKIEVLLFNTMVDKICGCSEAVCMDIIGWGTKKNKCCYIDNCIDFSRLDVDCENGKVKYNIQDKKVLMIYGSFFFTKGVDIAINAVKDIAEKYNIILLIVCSNKEFVLEETKKIINPVPGWIIIAPSQENIAFYYKMSDIYLTPSREEGFSYSLLESIYCGTPIIRSDLPSMDRNLPKDVKIPVNDVSALQQCIISLLNQAPASKEAMLKEQKEYIISRWNIDIWSNKVLDMYLQCI